MTPERALHASLIDELRDSDTAEVACPIDMQLKASPL
jgi:hypothetical protein